MGWSDPRRGRALAVRRLHQRTCQARHQDQPWHAFDASGSDAACALAREHRLSLRRRCRSCPLQKPARKEKTMFSVIFEVLPAEGKKDAYLYLGKHLKPILESIDGFVDNERFESQLRPGWVLSHSTWRDEKSLVRWRTEGRRSAKPRSPPSPKSRLTT